MATNRRIRCYGNNTKSVMQLLVLLSLSLLLVRESLCKVNQTVPTYFGRKDENGKLIDATDKKIWQKVNVKNVYATESNQTVAIEVKPSIVRDGHFVSVSWKGVTNPKETDFVAFYCPEHAKDSDYVDYFSVRESPTTTYKDGVGHHSVRLTNLRTNCEFRYFTSISNDVLERIAVSNIVMFEGGPEMPLQIHLALTGNPTEMRVMWVSATDETPVVTYGANPKNLKSIAKGKSQTYTASDLCSIQGLFVNPGYVHDVLLTGLKPYSVYYYSCGVPGHMSAIRSFKTALPGGSDVSFKFLAYGDMGISAAARRTAKYILADVEKNNYEFILHNGDISYALGVSYIWDQWHSLIQPYSSIVPYMVGIGNHEQNHIDNSSKDPSGVKGDGFHPWWGTFDDDSHGECGVPMFYRFHMPDNGNHVWWYSFDYGLVHFVMISTEHDLSNGTRQYAWLENDLKNVNRSITPWIILGGHRPMYCSQVEPDEFTVALAFQAMFENLLYEYKVDLALWAHYHSYERTCAMYQNKCVKGGTVHIVIGTAGREADWPPFWSQNWSKFQRHVDPYGYGRVKIVNRTALLWEYFVNKEEGIADYVWLIKEDKLD